MATVKKIADLTAAVTGPTAIAIEGSGAFAATQLWVQTTATSNTTSTWTVTVFWHSPTGTGTTARDQIATVTGIDATTAALAPLTMTAPFDGSVVSVAVPVPNMYTITRTATSSSTAAINGELWAAFAGF